MSPRMHACPHRPQLLVSALGSVQTPLQTVFAQVQRPEEHVSPRAQMVPQRPQLVRSVLRFTHRPLQMSPEQTHLPDEQTSPGP